MAGLGLVCIILLFCLSLRIELEVRALDQLCGFEKDMLPLIFSSQKAVGLSRHDFIIIDLDFELQLDDLNMEAAT